MKYKWCHNKINVKTNRVCATNQVLEGGFVAKASSLKSRPNHLYINAKINGQNVSCLVDTMAMHYFMSPKLAKELGLPMRRAGMSINMRFAKDKPHKTKEMALNVNLKCGMFRFTESFTLNKLDEVDLIFGEKIQKNYKKTNQCLKTKWNMSWTKKCC